MDLAAVITPLNSTMRLSTNLTARSIRSREMLSSSRIGLNVFMTWASTNLRLMTWRLPLRLTTKTHRCSTNKACPTLRSRSTKSASLLWRGPFYASLSWPMRQTSSTTWVWRTVVFKSLKSPYSPTLAALRRFLATSDTSTKEPKHTRWSRCTTRQLKTLVWW